MMYLLDQHKQSGYQCCSKRLPKRLKFRNLVWKVKILEKHAKM